MNQDCYNLLLTHSPPTVIHEAIRAGLDWNHLYPIVKVKVNALTMEDKEKTNLLPFMMVAEQGSRDIYGLSVVYEMLCMKPEALKEYDDTIC